MCSESTACDGNLQTAEILDGLFALLPNTGDNLDFDVLEGCFRSLEGQ
jgi:hypothetical protein